MKHVKVGGRTHFRWTSKSMFQWKQIQQFYQNERKCLATFTLFLSNSPETWSIPSWSNNIDLMLNTPHQIFSSNDTKLSRESIRKKSLVYDLNYITHLWMSHEHFLYSLFPCFLRWNSRKWKQDSWKDLKVAGGWNLCLLMKNPAFPSNPRHGMNIIHVLEAKVGLGQKSAWSNWSSQLLFHPHPFPGI